MTEREINDWLRTLSEGVHEPAGPAVMEAIRRPLLSSLAPVRPLPGTPALTAAFFLVFGLAAAAGALFLGFAGWHALSLWGRAAIFTCLPVLALAAAWALARAMRPGAGGISGWAIPIAAFVLFEAIFFLLLRDYSLQSFFRSGLVCLGVGLAACLPAGLAAYLMLRAGYLVLPVATGAVAGLGAGLVGLTLIELHCVIETFPHVAVWHAGIFVLSTALGALAGRWADGRPSLFRDNMQGVPKDGPNKG